MFARFKVRLLEDLANLCIHSMLQTGKKNHVDFFVDVLHYTEIY